MMQKKRWLTKSGMLMHMAEELSYSPATIRKLCSGERRPSAEATKKLLQLGQEAGLNRAWGNDLLESTRHFSDQQIADELDGVF
jgi:transcriptional regulator with XRE-family HTH domain